MRIGIRLPPAGPISVLVRAAQAAEEAGIDMCWMSDSPLNYREVWSCLGAIAVSTSRIDIGPMVTNPVSRHPSVTASAARTISEAAPGRFTLGLGIGDSAVGYDGMKPARVAELEQAASDIRALIRGNGVVYGDFTAHLRDADQTPPILIAAAGPKTQEMAARVGDGVVLFPGRMEEKLARVAAAAAAVGKPRPQVYLLDTVAVIDDPTPLLPALKMRVVRSAQLEGTDALEAAGFHLRGDFLNHTVGAHGDVGHAKDTIAAARVFDDAVSDELALWFMKERTFMGTADEIAAKFHRYAELGVDGAYVSQVQSSVPPFDLINVLGDLLPRLPRS